LPTAIEREEEEEEAKYALTRMRRGALVNARLCLRLCRHTQKVKVSFPVAILTWKNIIIINA